MQRRFGFTWCTFRVWCSICIGIAWALGIDDATAAWGGKRGAERCKRQEVSDEASKTTNAKAIAGENVWKHGLPLNLAAIYISSAGGIYVRKGEGARRVRERGDGG